MDWQFLSICFLIASTMICIGFAWGWYKGMRDAEDRIGQKVEDAIKVKECEEAMLRARESFIDGYIPYNDRCKCKNCCV